MRHSLGDIVIVEGNNELNVEMIPVAPAPIISAPTGEKYLSFEPASVGVGELFYLVQKIYLSRSGYNDGYRIRTRIDGASYRYKRIDAGAEWQYETVYKCKHCGYFSTSLSDIRAHLLSQHVWITDPTGHYHLMQHAVGYKYVRNVAWYEEPLGEFQVDFAPYWFFSAADYGKSGYGSPDYEPFSQGEVTIEGRPGIFWSDWVDGGDSAYFLSGELSDVRYTRNGIFRDADGRPHEWVMANWPVIIPNPGIYKVYSTLLYDKWGGTNCRNSYIYGEEDVPWRDQLVATIEAV